MTTILRHFYHLLRATMWLALAFARASWYFKNRALRDLALPQPEALTSKEKRRLKHYFYGATYLSSIFCLLRGYSRSRREKHLFTNLAALAYFFDDLVDAFREKDDSGILWLDNPELFGQTADPRGLALHFLHNIYRELPPEDLAQFKNFMHLVFNVETREIGNWKSEIGDLEKVTAEKGGCSVLLFRRVLANPLPAQEQEALFQFGFFIQLCDDIFDLWHDRQAGTTTLATFFAEKNDIAALRQIFEKQVVVLKNAFSEAPPSPPIRGGDETPLSSWRGAGGEASPLSSWRGAGGEASPLSSWRGAGGEASPPLMGRAGGAAVHYLVAVTRVCLRHYEDLQKKDGTLPLNDRAAMVVDMEKWENRLRAARELVIRN